MDEVDQKATEVLKDLRKDPKFEAVTYDKEDATSWQFARSFMLMLKELYTWDSLAQKTGSPHKTNLANMVRKDGDYNRRAELKKIWRWIERLEKTQKVPTFSLPEPKKSYCVKRVLPTRIPADAVQMDDSQFDYSSDSENSCPEAEDFVAGNFGAEVVEKIEKWTLEDLPSGNLAPSAPCTTSTSLPSSTTAPPPPTTVQDASGFVYILTDASINVDLASPEIRWKVGSSKDPQKRCMQLRTGNLDLRLVAYFPVSLRLAAEAAAHAELAKQGRHISLEWFKGDMGTIVESVFRAARPWHLTRQITA